MRRLRAAPSNLPSFRNGAGVWRTRVMPALIDLPRVAAHYAIAGPSERYADPAEVHAFGVERREWSSVAADRTSLALGRIRVTARVTGEIEEADVAVLHREGEDTHCRVRTATDPKQLGSVRTALFRIFLDEGPARIPQALAHHFEGRPYGTEAVFCDERRRLLMGRLVDGGSVSGPDVLRRRPGRRLLTELRKEGPMPASLLRAAAPLLAGTAREELALWSPMAPWGRGWTGSGRSADAARSLGIAFELLPGGISPDRIRTRPGARGLGSGRRLRRLSTTPSPCSRSAKRCRRCPASGRSRPRGHLAAAGPRRPGVPGAAHGGLGFAPAARGSQFRVEDEDWKCRPGRGSGRPPGPARRW